MCLIFPGRCTEILRFWLRVLHACTSLLVLRIQSQMLCTYLAAYYASVATYAVCVYVTRSLIKHNCVVKHRLHVCPLRWGRLHIYPLRVEGYTFTPCKGKVTRLSHARDRLYMYRRDFFTALGLTETNSCYFQNHQRTTLHVF